MKIIVLGNGFVGKPLAIYLEADTSPKQLHDLTKEDLDPYDVVINTAAKTSIDWCEKNKLETFSTNVIDALHVANMTRGQYVFFSSACIFKSETPDQINYEDSIPNPQCFYTYTKLMAEQLLAETHPDTLVVRPRLLISEHSHPRNTIDKLLKYTRVIDNQESATIMEDMFPLLKKLIEEKAAGPRNVFNEGTISPSEIMDIFNHPHTKITKAELDVLTKDKARRVSTVLGTHYSTLPEIKQRIRDIRATWHIEREVLFKKTADVPFTHYEEPPFKPLM